MNEFHATHVRSALSEAEPETLAIPFSQPVMPMSRKRNIPTAGLTLVELLVTICVISLLIALAPPALTSLLGAGNMNRSVDQLSAVLDLSRSEAIGKDTYVWLGLQNATVNGNSAVQLAAVKSLDGSPNLAASNIEPISRQVILPSTKLVSLSGLSALLQSKISADAGSGTMLDISSASSPQSFQAGNQTFTTLILFTPEGEALVPQASATTTTTPFVPHILIALRTARGTQLPASDANGAAILLNGGNSSQQDYRP